VSFLITKKATVSLSSRNCSNKDCVEYYSKGFTTLSYKEFGDNGYFVTLKKLLPEKFLGLVNIKHNNSNNSQ
tara:strand:+ start:248 stop:463 length:216 start_codon:yes stop_codon:yes gene_type:complete